MKHELVLLQGKVSLLCLFTLSLSSLSQVQSQDEVITAMRRELQTCRLEKSLIELEFNQYQQHMATTLTGLATRGAQEWLTAVEERRTDDLLASSEEDENTTHNS